MLLLKRRLSIYVLFTLALGLGWRVFAAELYEVKNIVVSSKSSDTTKARTSAIIEGQVEAFKVILSKLQASYNIKTIPEVVQPLIRSYEVSDEKMSPGQYRAIINVYFSKSHLDSFLQKSGVGNSDLKNLIEFQKVAEFVKPISDLESRRILVLPVFRKNGEFVVWEEDSPWKEAWNEYDLSSNSNKEYIVALGDLEDIQLTSKMNIVSASYNQFFELLKKYKANEVLIVTSDLIHDSSSGIYKLIIMIKQLNINAPDNVIENYDNIMGEDLKILYKKGVESVINSKGNAAKYSQLKAHGSDVNMIAITVNAPDLQKWVKIQNKMAKSKLINKYFIRQLSNGKFYLDLY